MAKHKNRSGSGKRVTSIVFSLIISLIPDILYASADGFNYSRRLLMVYGVLLAILIVVACYCLIRVRVMVNKNNKSRSIMAILAKTDSMWDIDKISKHIEATFFAVERALANHEPNIAKEVMSKKLYDIFENKITEMTTHNIERDFESIYLAYAEVVEVDEFIDKSKDHFWTYIKASATDSRTTDRSEESFIKKMKSVANICELWKFSRLDNSWLLDEIIENATIQNIAEHHSSSEQLAIAKSRRA